MTKKFLKLLFLFLAYSSLCENTFIAINQEGYIPFGPKKFMVANTKLQKFYVKNKDGKIVYKARFIKVIDDKNSGDLVKIGDFSGITNVGEYYIELPDGTRSYTFEISSDVYKDVFKITMRSFYLQRCGVAVEGGDEKIKHEACHLEDAEFHEDVGLQGRIDVTGGWHDAGDYGKYIPNAGITCGTLLWMWEFYEKKLENISLDIPKIERNLPDVLEEIKYEIDWFFKMQREDGGVYFKVAPVGFGELVLPEKDKTKRYVYKISSVATGNFVAVMAAAARVYKKYLPEYAQKCLEAAEKGWKWLEKNPDIVPPGGFDDPAVFGAGYEGDKQDIDERLWAAAELFATTGEKKYNEFFIKNYTRWEPTIDYPPSWMDTHVMGMLRYLITDKGERNVIEKIKVDLIKYADSVVDHVEKDGYRVALKDDMYYWGSNAVALNVGVLLIFATKITKERKYLEAAFDQICYILGRNSLGKCFITGLGKNPVINPHHGPSFATKTPWPGFVVGGPNENGGDDVINVIIIDNPLLPKAKRYVDIDKLKADFKKKYYGRTSYATNEPCISYNAPFQFLIAEFLD
ncbi:MAG: glycoside hydrolase family 9 protein [Endomicrobiia bacterium]